MLLLSKHSSEPEPLLPTGYFARVHPRSRMESREKTPLALDTDVQAQVVGHPPLVTGSNMLSQLESPALSDRTERDNKSGCRR